MSQSKKSNKEIKINIPKEFVYNKDGYVFLKIGNKSNFIKFTIYMQNELIKILKKIEEKSINTDNILLHTGNKILKKKILNYTQLWMEPIDKYSCWLTVQILSKFQIFGPGVPRKFLFASVTFLFVDGFW